MKNVRNIFSDKDFQKYNKLNEAENFVDAPEDTEKETDDLQEEVSDDLTEEELLTEDATDGVKDKKMSDEDLKVEALKIATNIAKLMSNVTAQDVVTIAGTVSDFIRNHEIGSAETSEDFLTKEDAADEEAPAESADAEKVEEFETTEKPEEGEVEEFKTGDEEVSDESES